MDECNDKAKNLALFFLKLLDYTVGDVRTQFLDMFIVNTGTSANLLKALKDSLSKKV